MRSLTLSVAFLVLAMAEARSVPQNVRDLYNKVKGGRCEGSDNLGGGFYDEDGGDPRKRPTYVLHSLALKGSL